MAGDVALTKTRQSLISFWCLSGNRAHYYLVSVVFRSAC